MTVAARINAAASSSVQPFSASSSGTTVTVLGAIETSSPCYSLTASGAASDGVIDATVTATTISDLCVGVLGRFNYTLTLSGVPRGSWMLRVKHQIGATSRVQAYETAIRID